MLFALPQRRLRAPAFGDVFNHRHAADNALALQMDRRENYPNRRGLFRGDGMIHVLIKNGLAFEHLPNAVNNLLIPQRKQVQADQDFFGRPDNVDEMIIARDNDALFIKVKIAQGGILEKQPVFLLAFPQRLLHAFLIQRGALQFRNLFSQGSQFTEQGLPRPGVIIHADILPAGQKRGWIKKVFELQPCRPTP